MFQDQISQRQLLVLLFTALLSPAVETLPKTTALLAGRSAWLTALAALPVFLVLCMVLMGLFRHLPPGAGLGEALQAALGHWPGRLMAVVYLVWLLFLLAVNARLCSERLLAVGYRKASLTAFLLLLLALVLWAGLGKLSSFARAGEIFYFILALCLGTALVFSLVKIKAAYLLPVWGRELPGIGLGAVSVLGILSYSFLGAVVGGQVTRRKGDRRRTLIWACAFCGVLTLLQLTVVGQFGPTLTAGMEGPFFQLVAGIGLQGAFQRLEAVAAALWVFSDLALLGLLTLSCRTLAGCAFALPPRRARWVPVLVVLLTLAGALLLFPDALSARRAAQIILPTGNLILGLGVPALILFVLHLHKSRQKKE